MYIYSLATIDKNENVEGWRGAGEGRTREQRGVHYYCYHQDL